MKLTEAIFRNLRHVRDHGKSMPRSNAGYRCRVNGLVDFLWRLPDGSTVTFDELRDRQAWDQGEPAGERLTAAGLAALALSGEGVTK